MSSSYNDTQRTGSGKCLSISGQIHEDDRSVQQELNLSALLIFYEDDLLPFFLNTVQNRDREQW
jgi:hypothetical protein